MIIRPTLVCNIRTSPRLVEQAHREGRFVLIDRTTIWGNPWSDRRGTTARWVVPTREEAIARYDEWLMSQPVLVAQLPTLRSKLLGCWCLPNACHGTVLARRADAAA